MQILKTQFVFLLKEDTFWKPLLKIYILNMTFLCKKTRVFLQIKRATKTCFLWLQKQNKSLYLKIVYGSLKKKKKSAKSLISVSPFPDYGPGLISFNFDNFFNQWRSSLIAIDDKPFKYS